MRIETRTHGLRLNKTLLARLERHIHSELSPWSLRASSAQLFLNGANELPGDESIGRLVVRYPKVGKVVVTDRSEHLLPLVKHLGRRAAAAINRRLERRRTLRRKGDRHRDAVVVA